LNTTNNRLLEEPAVTTDAAADTVELSETAGPRGESNTRPLHYRWRTRIGLSRGMINRGRAGQIKTKLE
jgi:hypothetical protein